MARRTREPAPYEVLASLATALEGGPPLRGYVLRGEERYFQERALECLRAAVERVSWEVRLHDAQRGNPDFRLAGVIDDLGGAGLFHAQSLVVVRHAEEALKTVAGDPSPLTLAIERFAVSDGDPGAVVLTGTGLRADLRAVKALSKAGGEVLGFRKLWDSPPPWNPDPRQAELVLWITRRARELGLRLDPRQAVYVAAATGNDLFALEDQFARLAAAPAARLEDVIGWDATTAPWEVAERLLEGDLPRALAGIQTLYRGGFLDKGGRRTQDAVALSAMLIGSLSRGVRQGLALADELQRGVRPEEALRRVRFSGPPSAREAVLTRARTRPVGAWHSLFVDVLELEGRAKSGAGVDADDFCALALRWRGARFREA